MNFHAPLLITEDSSLPAVLALLGIIRQRSRTPSLTMSTVESSTLTTGSVRGGRLLGAAQASDGGRSTCGQNAATIAFSRVPLQRGRDRPFRHLTPMYGESMVHWTWDATSEGRRCCAQTEGETRRALSRLPPSLGGRTDSMSFGMRCVCAGCQTTTPRETFGHPRCLELRSSSNSTSRFPVGMLSATCNRTSCAT